MFRNLQGKYVTLKDYLEAAKEKHENKIFYVTDEKEQSQYINMFREEKLDAVILTHNIDNPFITHEEQKHEGVKFLRIDADVNEMFKEEVKEEDKETLEQEAKTLTETFRRALGNDKLEVKVEKLKNESVSSMITVAEETRRMQEMMKMYNMYGMDPSMFGTSSTLVLNANNALVKYLFEHPEGEHTNMICEQLYDLAMISQQPLNPDEMTRFIQRSNDIMMILAK